MEVGCHYGTILGQAFGWTHLIPSLITLSFTLLTWVTGQLLYSLFGWYLHAIQLILWVIQINLSIDRPDPLCQEYHTFAFPSTEAFYIGAIVAFIVGYSIAWRQKQSILTWISLFVLFVAPPTLLVFLSYNLWYEVLISIVIGCFASSLFIILLWVYISDDTPYLLTIVPFSWLHYKDTLICSLEDKRKPKLREALDAFHRL